MAAVVQQNDLVFEFASNVMEDEQQLGDPAIFPAVIVEHVPGADILNSYAGLACVEEPNDMITESSLDVAEEEIIDDDDDDITLTVEASCPNGDETIETIEAAEALLNMDSPGPMLDEKRINGIPEVMETQQVQETYAHSPGASSPEQPKRKKGRKTKPPRPDSPATTPNISVKKKNKDGKGNTIYLWEFLLALLQDKATCPKYIKWTQREKGIFKLVDSKAVSRLWGKHKNKPDMNYETMGRALRYYYQRGILAKVEGQRLVYQFKEMPKDLIYIDDEDPGSSIESSDPSLSSTTTSSRNQASRSRVSSSPGIKGGATTVLKPGNSKATKPKDPVEVAQPSEVLRTMQPTQSPYPTQLFRTIHVVQPVQAVPEGEATVTNSMQDETLNSSVQSIRTIQAPTQVPVVVSPGSQHLHTVTLQTVPITTVIASTDPSSGAGSQKFILQAIPSSQPMTVLKENVMLQSQKPGSPPSIVLSPAHVQQVLTSNVQSICNGTVTVASSPSFSATTPVVTFSPRSSQLVAHPPGTVITSVIKAQETKTLIQEVEKKETEDNLNEDVDKTEPQPQPYVMVVSNSNGFSSQVARKQNELLEPNSF
ncbi:ETS-related transcription factor Elf-1 isoform X2 [Vulpes vulpes]|uniref:ETS-related transcription factor Elf-1 isoform X2 n=1 Tax=Vulpes vulpes TaxID=9627 RepID=A0A3Q7T7H4_VULVU|nr:ETS-related transcription factor Elf-1 isoform X2 [Vulpes vulpes]XP_035560242.1 ETS-related transcription factor Elf-1 isoform X2 [Canis lupus dingo]XP_038287023.1 ETS-related transcription factor Elf-1 isoform X2 [Canis lupus familiaris]XP_038312732.1 ETS-related transcription factor Elf-1 isoform X2 [Canis lupus familiaris]XP_038425598.1 ETS-related transcription factor Elf-1 isoform X2 [Canis lupus familiaris]XP_041587029.1 ETS-related transcription factor Elf-1 isoform X2 [Vulpes lagopu|eukprot:XP_022264075.1 ETS-related transcription factor Elf-1 isoform X2 [Canis lupus familiaris]